MKTLARTVALLVVLGFCLPSYGEILVYKGTFIGTYFEQRNGEWGVENRTFKVFLVIDVDYGDFSIVRGQLMSYQTDKEHGKWFEQWTTALELVRAEQGTKVQWVIMDKAVNLDGDQVVSGDFTIVAGAARNRNIGTEANHEVATPLTGYGLSEGSRENEHDFAKLKISVAFYPVWTYWANGDEGNQDFDTTVQMITDYLIDRGYTERN